MAIIISKNGKDARKIDKSEVEKEDFLQNYIHNNPESIPVYELAKDKKLFVAKREFPTNSGPIDALAVDKDGDIYIVETKLYKNPDKRTVIAQALDYGAALWKHMNDFSEFIRILDEESQKKFDMSFEEKVKEFFSLDDEQLGIVLEGLKTNLNDGNLKFVILMDALGERLKDLILYVNQNSQFDIYAVQLEFYKYEDYEITIPKLFGIEVKKNIGAASAGKRRVWNEQDFINQAKENLKEDANKLIELYNYFKNNADKIKWGTGNVNGSFAPIFNKLSKTISPFSFYSGGHIYIKFKWLDGHTPEEILKKYYNMFVNELRKNTNLEVPDDYLTKEFGITREEFFSNYDGVAKAIKKLVENI